MREFLDSYSRVARISPALLSIAPLAWTIAALNPILVSGNATRILASAIAFFGGMTLLATLARSCGKSVEPRLISAWGGWRTTALLRHRDTTIDVYTKARYHKTLQAISGGLMMPTVGEERLDPQDADARYQSATRRLIELRRDPKYALLHKENALYGFRRNLLGLKPLSIFIILCATIFAVTILLHGIPQPPHVGDLYADAASHWPLYLALIANIFCLFMWLTMIRPSFVLQAADEYALSLFRTLEVP